MQTTRRTFLNRSASALTGLAVIGATGLAVARSAAEEHPDRDLLHLGKSLEESIAAAIAADIMLGPNANVPDDHDVYRLYERTRVIIDEIELLPALTVEGLRVKAQAFAELWRGDGGIVIDPSDTQDKCLSIGIIRDLLKI